MSNTEKTPLSKDIKIAGLGRRTLSVFLDALFFLGATLLLYYTLGNGVILANNDYYPALNEQKVYIESTGLLQEATEQRGSYKYVVYTDPEDAEATGNYAYKKYIDLVWGFFMDFIPPRSSDYTVNLDITISTPVTQIKGYADTPSASSQEYGKWIYANFFAYSAESTSNYFVPSIENDFTSKPVADKDPKQYHKVLLAAMFDSNVNKGHYADACVLLGSQPIISQFTNRANLALWAARLPGLLGSALVFFMIIPFFVPSGKTLGKLILGIAIIGKDGYNTGKLNILLRQLVITVIWSLLALPWVVVSVPLFFAFIVIEYGFIVMKDRHVGLHDMLAGTIAIDGRKSTWFASKEDEDDFIESHPQSPIAKKRKEEEELNSPAYLAAQARIAAEESILDLSTINKRREEARAMTSFDEFEREGDAKFEEKKAEEEKRIAEEPDEPELSVDELAEMEGISKEEAEALLKEDEPKEVEETAKEPEEDDTDGFTDTDKKN